MPKDQKPEQAEAAPKQGVKAQEAQAPEAKKEAATPKTAAPSNGKAILIVEDEKPLSHAMEMKLHNAGFEAVPVTNGEDALKAIAEKDYAMLLLDLIMPRMDGFTMLGEMKRMGKNIPVIVLSNLGQEEDRQKAKEMGAIDYFVKSNTPISQIVKRVTEFLNK